MKFLPPYPGQIIEVPIHDLGLSGEGIGSYHGFTLFIEGALPEEVVRIKVSEIKKRYGYGKLISIIKSSPSRILPLCPVFGSCGGCQLMHLQLEAQLEFKRNRVLEALKRIGKFENSEVAPCSPSPQFLGYRNKIQLPVTLDVNGACALGLYARESHTVIPIEKCPIHCALGENAFQAIRSLLKETSLRPYSSWDQAGELRYLLIKSGIKTNESLVVFVCATPVSSEIQNLAHTLLKICPTVKGVLHYYNPYPLNTVLKGQSTLLAGKRIIHENLLGLNFEVAAEAFFQVNPPQAEALYAKAIEVAKLTPESTVIDAYCGVGTMTLLFGQKVSAITGIEVVASAVRDAQRNAMQNHLKHVKFECAPVEKTLRKCLPVDLVILNPPRKGCKPTVLEALLNQPPEQLLYISCDPATLGRDLKILSSVFHLKKVYPFDMFPQTTHVESLAVCTRR